MYDLGAQFKYELNNTQSKTESTVTGKKYRFSVLTPRLIRMEYSETGEFTDLPSQFATFRDFPKTNFILEEDDKVLEISTSRFRLEYLKEKSFEHNKVNPGNNLKVTLIDSDKEWYYNHPEVRRFNSLSTLDLSKKEQIEVKGLYSLDGFASYDDSKSLIINEGGTLENRKTNSFDIYLFMYGPYYEDALKDYFQLTGKPNLIPRYALGNWWSKDNEYNTETIKELVTTFEQEKIPLSVLLLDKDWSKHEDKAPTFSFNKMAFSNPAEIIGFLSARKIRLGLNINPENGILPHETYFDQITKYLIPKDNKIISEVTNPRYVDVYLKLVIGPLENLGVSFFWNDIKQSKKNNDAWLYNHYHYLDSGKNAGKRAMLMSRPNNLAPHRSGVVYSGKTEASWETLRKLPSELQAAANAGISWISHDVGGHEGGVEENELYIRSVQLGVYSPILRFHSGKSKYYKREPWRWDIKTKTVVTKYLNHRHELIPYLYSEAYNYYNEGKVLIKPLYYDKPWVYDDVTYKNQYFFGSQLMVAPILTKKDITMDRTIQKLYLPDGIWYDFNNGKKFIGNKKHLSFYKEEEYPVFARGGSIIPLSIESERNNIDTPRILEIHFFPGQNNSYLLYEDDGISNNYQKNNHLKTRINYNYLPNDYRIMIQTLEGNKGYVPDLRTYRLRLRNVRNPEKIEVRFNSDNKQFTPYQINNDFVIEIKDVDSVGNLVVNVSGKNIEIEAARVINDDIDSIIMDLQINTYLKEELASIIFSDEQTRKKRVEIRKLKKKGLAKQYIKLFLKLLDYLMEF